MPEPEENDDFLHSVELPVPSGVEGARIVMKSDNQELLDEFAKIWDEEMDEDEDAPLDDEPPCECLDRGQPMTPFGVMHTVDCQWMAWFRSTGGCMGDD